MIITPWNVNSYNEGLRDIECSWRLHVLVLNTNDFKVASYMLSTFDILSLQMYMYVKYYINTTRMFFHS